MQNFCENCNNDKTMQTTEVQREIYVSLFKLWFNIYKHKPHTSNNKSLKFYANKRVKFVATTNKLEYWEKKYY